MSGYNNFNSHTREGVTADEPDIKSDSSDFNSHTREGVTYGHMSEEVSVIFQLTHP